MNESPVRLTDPTSGATADVAVAAGFNCFSWKTPFPNAPGDARELLWAEPGFEAGDLRASRSGVPLLAPFPGRIAEGVLEWEGKRYDLEKTGGDHAIHGFALRSAWRNVDQSATAVTAEYQPSVDDPAALPQWPSDYRLRATYRIEAHRLVLDFSCENVGEATMPFGFGTHAYFRLPLADGADPEATIVRAAVDAEWLSEGMIPTGESTPIGAAAPLPAGAALAGREFDTPYRFAQGATTTELVEPQSGRVLRQAFDESMTCCVIYTPGHREAICLEPYTCTPDPVAMTARGVKAGLITLAPGESYQTRVVLEAASV